MAEGELFERWDGGHCYLRVRKYHRDGLFEILRIDKRVKGEDLEALGRWIGEVSKKDPVQKTPSVE